MHVGLIGGIGVAATLVYYQRLTARCAAAGVVPEITIVHADVQELIRNNLADDRAAQAQSNARLLARLADAGCDLAAITSLGGHFCFAETQAISPLPLVSAVTPLDDHFVAQGLGSVGLLGTRVVMQTRAYGQLARTRALAPDDRLDEVGQRYQDMAVAGRCTPEDRAFFFRTAAVLMDRGAEAIVLAGTDLNLAFDGSTDPGYPVIDALDVHVDLLARLASGPDALSPDRP
ncbi:aspartate racemase [Pseudaestuariivita atlantica]|uniref:Aspartate racemase n=1 Tax=Pseudaestuariivita atlantica TaxID=1317121 RepID=A0A0L1JTI9_9RHOB|nr:aspartate/glutamate racemase family protein [Pseudaestuariivita atlantica]KNG95089.1 aspartate racemase [Pseudaestuariivita atlantica]